MTTPYVLHFELKGLPKSPNALLGAHWKIRAGHASKIKRAVWAQVWHLKPAQPLRRAKVTLTRHSSGVLDADNLAGSFKAVLDALVKWGVLADDTPEIIGTPTYLHAKAPPKQGRIEIKVEQVIETQTTGAANDQNTKA